MNATASRPRVTGSRFTTSATPLITPRGSRRWPGSPCARTSRALPRGSTCGGSGRRRGPGGGLLLGGELLGHLVQVAHHLVLRVVGGHEPAHRRAHLLEDLRVPGLH